MRIRVDPRSFSPSELRAVAEIARRGGLVVYPTDTVYGLGTNPFIREAVLRVFSVKRRPLNKPLPVLVSGIDEARNLVELDNRSLCLAKRFWPGALTLVLPAKPTVPRELHAGLGKLGVRMPAHPVAISLIRLSGGSLVGTSANRHGWPSPRTADEALRQLGGEVDAVIDSGPAPGGVPSTVIELVGDGVRLVRRGPISLEEVLDALRECGLDEAKN